MLKQRLCDQYNQEWNACINSLSKLYCRIKKSFEFDKYIVAVNNYNHRRHISFFRLSSDKLEIKTGRNNSVTIDNRMCKCRTCTLIKSEFQFILCCTMHQYLRKSI